MNRHGETDCCIRFLWPRRGGRTVLLVSIFAFVLISLASFGRPGAKWLASQYSGLTFTFADTILLPTKSKYAIVTFLGRDSDRGNSTDYSSGHYYVGVRILAYQLLHDPETRNDIPFIVLVTQDVEQGKRQ